MAFTERLRLIIDVVAPSGGGLNNLKRDIGQAEGAFGKLRTAGAGAFDFLKQNAASVALGLGTALVGIGTKAVGDFQALALSAGKLTDSLGITADEASRLQEVAGDLSVPVETLEASIGKMNKAAAATPEAFDAIGAAIVRNADGTINVTETFLSAVEALNRIPDAAKRAEAAQKIFGRGWQQMAEMIGLGADGIRRAMASVEEGKIVSDSQIDQARSFRDTMDELKGIVEEASVELGARLVPALENVAEIGIEVAEILGAIPDALEDTFNAIPGIDDAEASTAAWGGSWDHLGGIIDEVTGKITGSIDSTLELATVQDDAALSAAGLDAALGAATGGYGEAAEAGNELLEALDAVTAAMDEQIEGAHNLADANRDMAAALVAANEARAETMLATAEHGAASAQAAAAATDEADAMIKVSEAAVDQYVNMTKAAGATATATGKIDQQNKALVEQASQATPAARRQIVAYIGDLNGIPEEERTEILTLLNRGLVAEAEAKINHTSRTRQSSINVVTYGVAAAEGAISGAARPRTATINVVAVGTSAASGAIAGAARPRSVTPTATGVSTYAATAPAPVAHVSPTPIYINVPPAKPTSITVNAGVVGNRFDVNRTVARALRRHSRINGVRQ